MSRNIVYYDIETYNYVMGKNKRGYSTVKEKGTITSIAYNDKCLTIGVNVDNEAELLAEFLPIINNPDNVLVAWNGLGFDDVIMKHVYSKKQVKCSFFDLMKGYGKFIQYDVNAFNSLKAISNQVGSYKDDVNPVKAYENKEYDLLYKYNLQDVKALKDIDEYYSITTIANTLSETTGISNWNSLFGVTKPLESYIKKTGLKIGRTPKNKHIENLGGLNFFNTKCADNLKHFDVRSFYPYMLLCLNGSSNLSYNNIKYTRINKPNLEDYKQVSSTFWVKESGRVQLRKKGNKYYLAELKEPFNDISKGNGDIAEITRHLIQYKQESTGNLQKAYKILVNGLYGALDSNYFYRNHKALSSAITFLCRYVLYNVIEKFGGVYAKTDSVWIHNGSEQELNEFSAHLLSELGLSVKEKDEYLIQWELESELSKIHIKSLNEYIEIYKDGTFNVKGNMAYPIQEKVIEEFIVKGTSLVDKIEFINKYINDVSLFAKNVRLSEKQKNQYQFNTVLSDKLGLPYTWDFKVYNYYSEYGYINTEDIKNPKLPAVDEAYALYVIDTKLYEYGLIEDKPKFNDHRDDPKFVPMYFNKKQGRPLTDNKKIAKALGLHKINFKMEELPYLNFNKLANKSKYKGLVLGKNYYAFDLDNKNTEFDHNKARDMIVKDLGKNHVLQVTKSGGWHIIFKTNKPIPEVKQKYTNIEFKNQLPIPFNCWKYVVQSGNVNNIKNNNKVFEKNGINQLFDIGETVEKHESLTVKLDEKHINKNILPDIVKVLEATESKHNEVIPAIIGYYTNNNIDIRATLCEAFRVIEDTEHIRQVQAYDTVKGKYGYNKLLDLIGNELMSVIDLKPKPKANNIELYTNDEIWSKVETLINTDNFIGDIDSLKYIFNREDNLYSIYDYQSIYEMYFGTYEEDDDGNTIFVKDNETTNELRDLYHQFVKEKHKYYPELEYNELVEVFKQCKPTHTGDVVNLFYKIGALACPDVNYILNNYGVSGSGKSYQEDLLARIFPNRIFELGEVTEKAFDRMGISKGRYVYNNKILVVSDLGSKSAMNTFSKTLVNPIKKLITENRTTRYVSEQYGEGVREIKLETPDGFNAIFTSISDFTTFIGEQSNSRIITEKIQPQSEEEINYALAHPELEESGKDYRIFADCIEKCIYKAKYNKKTLNITGDCNYLDEIIIPYSKNHSTGNYRRSAERWRDIINYLLKLYGPSFLKEFTYYKFNNIKNSLTDIDIQVYDILCDVFDMPTDIDDLEVAQTKSWYAHKNEYNCDAFTVSAVKGIKRKPIKTEQSQMSDVLQRLYSEGKIDKYGKNMNGENIYFLV